MHLISVFSLWLFPFPILYIHLRWTFVQRILNNSRQKKGSSRRNSWIRGKGVRWWCRDCKTIKPISKIDGEKIPKNFRNECERKGDGKSPRSMKHQYFGGGGEGIVWNSHLMYYVKLSKHEQYQFVFDNAINRAKIFCVVIFIHSHCFFGDSVLYVRTKKVSISIKFKLQVIQVPEKFIDYLLVLSYSWQFALLLHSLLSKQSAIPYVNDDIKTRFDWKFHNDMSNVHRIANNATIVC